jgi:tetratricopeptide (TPR) repeat protein
MSWQRNYDAGNKPAEQNRISEAEPLLRLALQEAEALGEQDYRLPINLSSLAHVCWKQGKLAEAAALQERLVAALQPVTGRNAKDVADCAKLVPAALNDLGLMYQEQGKYPEAVSALQRSVTLKVKEHGQEDPTVAGSLHNLAISYHYQGKYADAEPVYRRALAIRQKALGPKHPQVADTLNSLAFLLMDQEKYAEAAQLYKQALAIWEQALGRHSPALAQGLNNLGALYLRQGLYGEAEPLLKWSLSIRERSLPPGNPELVQTLNNLARVYSGLASDLYDQGKDAEAEPLYRRSLELLEKVYNTDHPLMADPVIGLANVYYNQGDCARAAAFYERSLTLMEKSLGPEHPDMVEKLRLLAACCYAQQDYVRGEPVCRRWLAMEKSAKGPAHADLVAPLMALADTHLGQGKLDSAIEALNEALHLNPRNAYALVSRSYALLNTDQLDACISDCDRLLQLDPAGGTAPTAHANRGAAWAFQGRFEAALADFEAAVELAPDMALNYIWKGMVLRRLGQDAQAKMAIAKSLEMDPSLAAFDTTRLDHIVPEPGY